MINYDREYKSNRLSAKDIDQITALANQIVRAKIDIICKKNSLTWLVFKKETTLRITAVEFRRSHTCAFDMVRKVESTDCITGFTVHFANEEELSFKSVRQFKSHFEII